MIMYSKFKMAYVMIVACFKELSQHLPVRTKENDAITQVSRTHIGMRTGYLENGSRVCYSCVNMRGARTQAYRMSPEQ
jgi:hypothetical protein